MSIGRGLLLLLTASACAFFPLHEGKAQERSLSIVSYNAENLFNPRQDTVCNLDTSFTPQSIRHWGRKRLQQKTLMLAKALIAASETHPLALVGLCEVEDSLVIHRLIHDTPLQKFNYRIIHRDGPDPRGIDVAMIYRPDLLTLIEARWIATPSVDSIGHPIREMLHATFLVNPSDTLHAIQCHWPSLYGGQQKATPRRIRAITNLKRIVDSITHGDVNAKIVVMGDMNTTADDTLLNGLINRTARDSAPLYNAMRMDGGCQPGARSSVRGTYKYKGHWQSIDMMLISKGLMPTGEPTPGIYIDRKGAWIATPKFLLERDNRHGGSRPKRTYLGPAYHGGTSDHLPIIAIFRY